MSVSVAGCAILSGSVAEPQPLQVIREIAPHPSRQLDLPFPGHSSYRHTPPPTVHVNIVDPTLPHVIADCTLGNEPRNQIVETLANRSVHA